MRQARWLAVALILSITSVAVGDGMAVTLDGLKSTTPADWKEARAMPPMQVQAFTLPRVEGDEADASLVVFFFGSGSGGSLEDNIKRWKGMVKPPEGKSAADATKSDEFALADGRVKVSVLDLEGTYLSRVQPMNPSSPVREMPGYRVVFVYFNSPNGPYTMRLVGPEKTVAKHLPGFTAWLKNFK